MSLSRRRVKRTVRPVLIIEPPAKKVKVTAHAAASAFDQLPREILSKIIHNVPNTCPLLFKCISKKFRDCVEDTRSLSLSKWSQNITDDVVQHSIVPLTKLNELDLSGRYFVSPPQLTDVSAGLIASSLRYLKVLKLSLCSTISDAGVKYLCSLRNLHELSLADNPCVSDVGISFLPLLKLLRALDLSNCSEIGNRALKYLSSMPSLECLKLSGCDRVNDRGIAFLSNESNLKTLDLSNSNSISNEGFSMLSNLTQLTSLNLSQVRRPCCSAFRVRQVFLARSSNS